MTTKTPKWLEIAACRSTQRSWMFGATLEHYCCIEGLTSEQLSSQLGCSSESLGWLSLCRRPSPENFAGDVLRIAERFHVDASKLAQIVRKVDAIAAIRQAGKTGEEEDLLLLAARDRDKGTKK